MLLYMAKETLQIIMLRTLRYGEVILDFLNAHCHPEDLPKRGQEGHSQRRCGSRAKVWAM